MYRLEHLCAWHLVVFTALNQVR